MSLTIKICGLSTPESLEVALDAGADMVGFVFFPPSPRNISFDAARALGKRAHGRAQKVALSVDAGDALLDAVVELLQPELLQLHGKETPARVVALKKRYGLPVMKAIAVEVKSRPLRRRRLCVGRRSPVVRCARAARSDTTGRPRQAVRLAAPGKSRSRRAVYALGRPRCRQSWRGFAHHPRTRRRRFLWCRTRARRERPRQDSCIRTRGPRSRRTCLFLLTSPRWGEVGA